MIPALLPSNIRLFRKGFSLVELMIVTTLSIFLITYVVLILSRYFSGVTKGFTSLSIMQEEGKLLSYLKHDLRTIIIGGDDNIPPPQLITDKYGNITGFSFHKVNTADEFGRPVWVNVVYELEKGSKNLFSISRTIGTNAKQIRMLRNMISNFSVQFFNQNETEPLIESNLNDAKKIRISLSTPGGELMQIRTDFYSPFLPTANASSSASSWLSNFHYQSFDSDSGKYKYTSSEKLLEYNGTPIDSKESLIKNAEGIGLSGETNKIWGH
jgi:hypothetical protein